MSDREGLVSIDFQKRFPHRYWLSSWSKDPEHPGGFRYKLLSTRLEPTGPIELVVVLEQPGGFRTEMNRIEVSPPAFEKTVAIYVDGLTDSYGLTFFAIDLTRCRSAADYERIVTDADWHSEAP